MAPPLDMFSVRWVVKPPWVKAMNWLGEVQSSFKSMNWLVDFQCTGSTALRSPRGPHAAEDDAEKHDSMKVLIKNRDASFTTVKYYSQPVNGSQLLGYIPNG